MRKVIINFLPIILICLMITTFTTTVYAAPDDNNQSNYDQYINDFVDDVSSALDDFANNNSNYFDSNDDSTDSTNENTATEPVTDATEAYVPPYYEEATEYEDFDTIYEQETVPYEEPTYEEATVLIEADENEDYDYSYTPPTEAPTEEYQPEILTETYTDPPFLERFAITDEEEGNLFIALGLWASIIIGVIIVLSVVIATHRRKKGSQDKNIY